MTNSIKYVLIICAVIAPLFYIHLRKIRSDKVEEVAQIASKRDTLFPEKKEDTSSYQNTSTALYPKKIDSNQTLSINFVNADFKSVIDSIERLTSYNFIYCPVYLVYTHKITFRATNITPEKLLKQIILREKMLRFFIHQNHTVVFCGSDKLINLIKSGKKD